MRLDPIFIFGFLMIGFIIGFWTGDKISESVIRREAIKANAAEYVCDPKTGETKFVWKAPNGPK